MEQIRADMEETASNALTAIVNTKPQFWGKHWPTRETLDMAREWVHETVDLWPFFPTAIYAEADGNLIMEWEDSDERPKFQYDQMFRVTFWVSDKTGRDAEDQPEFEWHGGNSGRTWCIETIEGYTKDIEGGFKWKT
jgi:hypothetical protein